VRARRPRLRSGPMAFNVNRNGPEPAMVFGDKDKDERPTGSN
jgi:hypothetical protein